jgi:hypothetical protein
MTRVELETFLKSMGVPDSNAATMADQLEKRAKQLSEKRNQSYEEAFNHLVGLLRQGWAAKDKKLE